MGYNGLGQERAVETPAPAPAPAPMPSAPAPASQPVDTQFVPTMRTLPETIARPERPQRPVTPVSQPWRNQDLFTRRWQPRPQPRSFVPTSEITEWQKSQQATGPATEELEAEERAREFAEWQAQQQANLLQPHGQLPVEEQIRTVEAAAEERAKALKDLWKNVPPPHGEIPTYRTIQEAAEHRDERQAIPVSVPEPVTEEEAMRRGFRPRPVPMPVSLPTEPVPRVTHNADGSVTDAAGVTWFWGPSGWEIQERDGRSVPSWYKKSTPTPILPPAPVQPESIWTQREEITGGGKFNIRGRELDDPKALSEIRIDDALASVQWYDLYGRTPQPRGGPWPSELPDIQRWRKIAFERYYELKSKGHTLSPLWSAFGGFIEGLQKNPLTYVVAYPIVPLLWFAQSFAEAPQTVDEAVDRSVLRATNMIEGGYNPGVAGFLAFVMAMGDLLPSNKFVESLIGYDLVTGRELTWKERSIRAAMAVVETGLWAIGSSKGKSFRLWALPERAPITTVATDFTVQGPKGPMPVLNPVAPSVPTGYRHVTAAEKTLLERAYGESLNAALAEKEIITDLQLLRTREGLFIREGFRLRRASSPTPDLTVIVAESGNPSGFWSGKHFYDKSGNQWYKYTVEKAARGIAPTSVTDAEAAVAFRAASGAGVPTISRPGYKAPPEPFTIPAEPAEGGGEWIYRYIPGQGYVRQLRTPGSVPGIWRPVPIGPTAPARPPSSLKFESGDYYYSLIKDQWYRYPKSGLEPGGGGGVSSGEYVTFEQAMGAARAAGADDAVIGKIRQQWLKATQGGTWDPIIHPSPTAEPFHPAKAGKEFLDQIVEAPPQELYADWLAKWAGIFMKGQIFTKGEGLVMKKLPWNLPTPLRGIRLKGINRL